MQKKKGKKKKKRKKKERKREKAKKATSPCVASMEASHGHVAATFSVHLHLEAVLGRHSLPACLRGRANIVNKQSAQIALLTVYYK